MLVFDILEGITLHVLPAYVYTKFNVPKCKFLYNILLSFGRNLQCHWWVVPYVSRQFFILYEKMLCFRRTKEIILLNKI